MIEEEMIGYEKGNREEMKSKHNPSPLSLFPSFQLYNLPHRTSVSRTVTFVGKLALPPTRRTKPLAEGAAHGSSKGGGRGIFTQNFSLIVLPPHSTKMSGKLCWNQGEELNTLVAATGGGVRRSDDGDGGVLGLNFPHSYLEL